MVRHPNVSVATVVYVVEAEIVLLQLAALIRSGTLTIHTRPLPPVSW